MFIYYLIDFLHVNVNYIDLKLEFVGTKQTEFMKKITHLWLTMMLAFFLLSPFAYGQSPKAERFATITVSVVNSERPYHVALIRYYDKDGNVLLNTSEEFKIDISKAARFKTGSIRKTIPIYPEAKKIIVTVDNCSGLHENDFTVEDLDAADSKLTFVFKREFEKQVIVRFKGIQDKKPCSFKIIGRNTNEIYYGDYVKAQKYLPKESNREDIRVKVAESTLYPYEIVGIKKDVQFKPEDKERYVDVTVKYTGKDAAPEVVEEPEGEGDGSEVEDEKPAKPVRDDFDTKKAWKKAVKEWKKQYGA